jgi:BlaI family transcriptional regulator, penicillinase repressor
MPKQSKVQALGHRERQIVDAVYRIGEASVGDVIQAIPNPPSYSAIRKMLNVLEQKGVVQHRCEGIKYVYRPTKSHQSASRSAVKHLLSTFFAGSIAEAVNTILDVSSNQLTESDFDRLQCMIEEARRGGQ